MDNLEEMEKFLEKYNFPKRNQEKDTPNSAVALEINSLYLGDQGCILSSCLFNFYAEYIMRNTGLEEAQAGIKIAGRYQ